MTKPKTVSHAEERERKISEYMNMLRADGIDPAEPFPAGAAAAEKSTKRAPPPKGQYVDENGEQRTDSLSSAVGYSQRYRNLKARALQDFD